MTNQPVADLTHSHTFRIIHTIEWSHSMDFINPKITCLTWSSDSLKQIQPKILFIVTQNQCCNIWLCGTYLCKRPNEWSWDRLIQHVLASGWNCILFTQRQQHHSMKQIQCLEAWIRLGDDSGAKRDKISVSNSRKKRVKYNIIYALHLPYLSNNAELQPFNQRSTLIKVG